MRRNVRFISILAIISILIGIGSGAIKKIYDEANEPIAEITVDDAIQMLGKDIQNNVEYYEKKSPIRGELPESWNANEEKSSSNEIIAMFLIDISGSMKTKSENKLIKVQEAISNSLQYIGPNSYVGMISYSTDVTVNVPIARFDEEQARKLNGEINGLTASGGTHMYEAIAVGMKLIEEEKEAHPNASVMMFVLSDGQPSDDAKGINFVEEYVRILNIPIHTIGYGKDVDKVELKKLSDINEATFSYVEKEDVVETFKALFDSNF